MWITALGLVAFGAYCAFCFLEPRRRAKRRQEIKAAALRAGLEYSEDDPFDCTRVDFSLFGKGEARGAENVVWRAAPDGHVCRAFDYWYYREDAEEHKTYRRWSCALALVGSSWPDIAIEFEGGVAKIASAASGDIDFESEEFNRLFVVRCADRRFATALLDARMLDLLIKTRGELSFEIKGRWLLVWGLPVRPDLVPGLLDVAESFVKMIPAVVWDLYPSTFVDEQGHPLPPGEERH